MKLSSKILSMLIIFAMLVGLSGVNFVPQAKAVETMDNNEKIFDIARSFKENAVEVSEQEKQTFIAQLNTDLQNKVVKPNLNSNIELDFENLMISGYLNGESKEYVISVPYIGDIEKGSLITIVYNESGNLVRTMEYQFKDLNEKYGQVKTWNDGNLSINQKIDKTQYDSGIGTMSWSCMNDCLASMGIANWVLAAIAIACAAACTTVVLCGPCIQGMGLILYFELDYCMDKCF